MADEKPMPMLDSMIQSVANATIKMFPHATDEKQFNCLCAKHHKWGERGTRTFMIPLKKYTNMGFRMIQCPCGIWHMQTIGGDAAKNFIDGGF